MYYYGARYYDPRISIFVSVDPLAERTMEPYLYAGNNPIRYVDPTGMSKDDVIIKGNMAQEAFASLQNSVSSELELKMNKRGKVTAKQIGNGQLSQGAADLLNATKDKSVTVNVNASDERKLKNGFSFRTGNFMGATYNEDGTATTKQEINPEILKKLDAANNATIGQSVLHEVTESYIAGKIVQERKHSVGFAIASDLRDPDSVYSRAHNEAVPPGGGIYFQPLADEQGNHIGTNFYTGQGEPILFHTDTEPR